MVQLQAENKSYIYSCPEEEVLARINDIFDSCSPSEQQQFIKIVDELSTKGYSETLEQIYLIDFKEVPVSIDRFLTDPYYLGKTNKQGAQIYPGWRPVYRDVFDASNDIYEVILSGATRIGKTSTAVSMMAYMLYLLMCYRNPQEYFGLKEVSRATVAFANLTKDLAQGVAFREFNDTLKKSPWFNEHGSFTNSATKPIYIPEGNQVELVTASDAAHVLGMQLWACLVGNTKVLTTSGYVTLADACDKEIYLKQIDDKGKIVECTGLVKLTKYVKETIKVKLNDGSIIEGTPDHKILLANGEYKELGDLTISDILLSRSVSYCGLYKNTQIIKIKKFIYDEPIPVYDIINAGEYHNFMVLAGESVLIAHNCIIDECNFARAGVKDLSISKRHMNHLYNTANARITGTFQLEGKIYGKMFTCSSKNSDNDYLSEHIEQQLDAGNKHMYLFDKPQWEVLPEFRFSKERFHITVGDRYKRGFVVPDENDDPVHLKAYEDEGYKVLEVPANYKPNFRADYDVALRDIAGISVVGSMGFITQDLITPNVSQTRKNPFYEDYIEIDGKGNDTIERHFHLEAVPPALKNLQMYIHLDLAEVSDHTGICGVVQDGTINVVDLETEKKVMMPYLKEVFQIAIGAPRGGRMSFQKVVNFILWLKRNGFWIQLVTTDQYQSSYVRETLNQQGIETEVLSVDKSMDAYMSLRNLLYDQRLELIKCELQEVEMINLQRVNDRVDHRPQSNSVSAIPSISNGYNSKGIGKDSSDSLAGACFALIKNSEQVRPPAKNVLGAIASVNGVRSGGYNPFGFKNQPNSMNISGFNYPYRR